LFWLAHRIADGGEKFSSSKGFHEESDAKKYQQISLAQNPDGRIFLDEELILSPDE